MVDCDEGKLQACPEGHELVDVVPWKISQLGRLEHSVQEPMQGLHLLRNFSWSQVSTEQGHSAASVVLKKHHTLGHQMPQTRSMLGQLRCLSAEPDGVRKLRTCRKVLHRLEQGRSAVTGRHMFVSELVFPIERPSIQVPWAKPRVSVARRVVSRHGARLRTLSGAQKSVFESRAALRTRDKIGNMERNFSEARH